VTCKLHVIVIVTSECCFWGTSCKLALDVAGGCREAITLVPSPHIKSTQFRSERKEVQRN